MASQAALHVLRAVDTAFEDDRPGPESQGGIFIQAASWQGPKPGYVFKTGQAGLGYYREGPLAPLKEAAVNEYETESSKKDASVLLQEAEQLAEDLKDLENIDDRGVKRIVAGVERRIRRNQELRLKHADDPQRFLESELELNELLTKLSALAGEPELYKQLVDQQSVPLLLELLQHENIDVVVAVIELFRDLTDADSVEDLDEECLGLVAAILAAMGTDLMVARLKAFKETSSDAITAVTATLQCFQNMCDVDPRVLKALSEHQLLIPWLVDRISVVKNKKFDENKGLAAELLATLAQFSVACQNKLLAEGAMDKLMVTMSGYRKIKKPLKDKDEEDFVLELCNIFSACCIEPAGKQQFLEFEGIELMLIMLKNRQFFRIGCIKVLAHATTEFQKTADLCVESKGMPGLPPLFGIFMGKNKTVGVKPNSDDARQQLEGVISIIANLMHYTKRANCDRVAAKFVENEFEKTDRLMEVYFQYQRRIQAAMERLNRREDVDEEDDIESELREAGQFMLQQMSLIFGYLWGTGDMLLRKRLLALLHQRKAALATVRSHLESLYTDISQQVEGAQTRMSRVKVAKMIVAMGGEVDLERVVQLPTPSVPPPLPEEPLPPLPPTLQDGEEALPPLPDDAPGDSDMVRPADEGIPEKAVPKDSRSGWEDKGQNGAAVLESEARGRDSRDARRGDDSSPVNRNGRGPDDRDFRHSRERERERGRSGARRRESSSALDDGRDWGRDRERDRGGRDRERRERDRERERDRGRVRDDEHGRKRDGPDWEREERDRGRNRGYRRDGERYDGDDEHRRRGCDRGDSRRR